MILSGPGPDVHKPVEGLRKESRRSPRTDDNEIYLRVIIRKQFLLSSDNKIKSLDKIRQDLIIPKGKLGILDLLGLYLDRGK